MFGGEETAPLPQSAYAPEVSRTIYQRMDDKAREALRAGQAVVLDSTFSTAEERRAAASVAAELGVAFDGLFLTARLDTRLGRIELRKADVSDADAAVARVQSAEPLGEKGWIELDAGGAFTETAVLALKRLGS
jgi:predicted kinase